MDPQHCFKDRQTLHKHEKIHDESTRSDPCPDCGKVLSSNDVLRIHIKRVHEKNFKHTCEDCGKSYPYLHALQGNRYFDVLFVHFLYFLH
jgi:hypothetical protein